MDLEEKAKYNPEKADQLKKRNENSHRIRHYYFYKFKTQTQIPILTPGLPRSFNGKFRHQENQWFYYEMLLWLHDKPHCFVHILILFKLC